MGKTVAAALMMMWVSIAALASVVVREIGWARMKRYTGTLAVLVLTLAALPAAAVYKVGSPYLSRIARRLLPHHSPTVNLSAAGCSVFPANNIWNAPVNDMPLDSMSSVYIQTMGPSSPLHADFSIPYGVTDGSEGDAHVQNGSDESDGGPYRIPDNAPTEPGEDSHVIVLDTGACRLYELYAAKKVGHLSWEAGSGAIFDLRSNQLRQQGWTSADAAGLPIFAGLVRYDEVKSGAIRHALRFTTPHTRRAIVWPARHFASRQTEANLPPMGQRFRLRSSFDTSGMAPQAQVILTALKQYGMFLADNGSPWFLTGAPDSNWDSKALGDLKKVTGADFEAVDTSLLMINADSGEAARH